ncbi:MAG: hypothetical protein R3E01_32770 [Pirellulaceae bacterium]
MPDDRNLNSLHPQRIEETIERLASRIDERFPNAGLHAVCQQLLDISRKARERSRWIQQPQWVLRSAITLVTLFLLFAPLVITRFAAAPVQRVNFVELIQTMEAGINDIVLLGAAIFFLTSLESRIKRRRALSAIHELRAIAHVIDMHQLTKDPEWILSPSMKGAHTKWQGMTAFELRRYLDYCSEMLSLTGKVAALYVQNFDDSVALAAVNDVEELTTGLSRKIWQKIMILHATHGTEGPISADSPAMPT